jgi:hypothetical protein
LAEEWVKGPGDAFDVGGPSTEPVDLSGFECRWRPAQSERGRIVSLIVKAKNPEAYAKVLDFVELLSEPEAGAPLSLRNTKIQGPFGDYSVEARMRSGHPDGSEFESSYALARKKATIGKVLMGFGQSAGGFDGTSYPLELIQNCDYRKFDDTLRMILDLTPSAHDRLLIELNRLETEGELYYGNHHADAALMTCFVRSFRGNHVHFVDGASGGYTLAAKELKRKLSPRASSA